MLPKKGGREVRNIFTRPLLFLCSLLSETEGGDGEEEDLRKSSRVGKASLGTEESTDERDIIEVCAKQS